MTGLAAAYASGIEVYEAADSPGGICSSYYLRAGDSGRVHRAPADGEAYRFEIGGGHWIFGGDPLVLNFIRSLTPTKSYVRKSSVYLDRLVPYPLQNHLRYLAPEQSARALREMVDAARTTHRAKTMADWLRAQFGPTLCDLFFDPFHDLYTAGLFRSIAPQDGYKSPVDLSLAIQGAFDGTPAVGYNATFVYPLAGLDRLASELASRCRVHYGKRVVRIDCQQREVHFGDGSVAAYDALLSTLPLNRMAEMTGLALDGRPNPAPAVLVINIGALRGAECPQDHWVYIPRSKARFHRVGFYSNVDTSFLPASARHNPDRVSIYIEKAYPEGTQLGDVDVKQLSQAVARELQEWGWIGDVEVIDPTWIEVAYTWSWPDSTWRDRALAALDECGIFQVGRFARWVFQGIADSIRDGLMAGAAFSHRRQL